MSSFTSDVERDDVVEEVHDLEEDRWPFEVEGNYDGRDLKVVDYDA